MGTNNGPVKTRELWVDDVKVIACILVTLGHFFQSMIKSNIVSEGPLLMWFDRSAYFFHVPLFFLMSGYLHQKHRPFTSPGEWMSNALDKLINLGIPYFVFCSATILLKKLAADSVNTQIGGLFNGLFVTPASPYWFIYALFFMFLLIPPMKSGKGLSALFLFTIGAHLASRLLPANGVPHMVRMILRDTLWFVLGMTCEKWKIINKINILAVLAGLVFIPASILVYALNLEFTALRMVMGFLGCLMTVSLVYLFHKNHQQTKLFKLLAAQTFPIYLMHTIFASGMRILLLKLGISSTIIHFTGGIAVSFAGPIIAAWVLHKLKYGEFILYPSKFVNIKKGFSTVKDNLA